MEYTFCINSVHILVIHEYPDLGHSLLAYQLVVVTLYWPDGVSGIVKL